MILKHDADQIDRRLTGNPPAFHLFLGEVYLGYTLTFSPL